MINIQISAFEALEFLKWKYEMRKSMNKGTAGDCHIPSVIERIDDQIQYEIYKDITVGTMKQGYVEALTEIINENTPKPIKINKP